jgi:hypothetical protein
MEQATPLEGYMTDMESARAMTGVLAEIDTFIAPMGGHIGREIKIMASGYTPAVTVSIGFLADVLKQYSAQGSVPE